VPPQQNFSSEKGRKEGALEGKSLLGKRVSQGVFSHSEQNLTLPEALGFIWGRSQQKPWD